MSTFYLSNPISPTYVASSANIDKRQLRSLSLLKIRENGLGVKTTNPSNGLGQEHLDSANHTPPPPIIANILDPLPIAQPNGASIMLVELVHSSQGVLAAEVVGGVAFV